MFKRFYKPDSKFVHVVITEVITDKELARHVEEYNNEAADRDSLLELADLRFLVEASELTVQGCIESAKKEQGQKRATNGKLAILAPNPLLFGMARAYATFSADSRSDARVFHTLKEALYWLGLEDDIEDVERFIESHLPEESV